MTPYDSFVRFTAWYDGQHLREMLDAEPLCNSLCLQVESLQAELASTKDSMAERVAAGVAVAAASTSGTTGAGSEADAEMIRGLESKVRVLEKELDAAAEKCVLVSTCCASSHGDNIVAQVVCVHRRSFELRPFEMRPYPSGTALDIFERSL